MRLIPIVVAARRPLLTVLGVGMVLTAVFVAPTHAQQAPAPVTFNSGAGVWLYYVKPDKTMDFEMVMSKLKVALANSDKPDRKQQGQGWKIMKNTAEAGASVLYIAVVEPAVKDADYNLGIILSEGFPTEVAALLKAYGDSLAMPAVRVNMAVVAR